MPPTTFAVRRNAQGLAPPLTFARVHLRVGAIDAVVDHADAPGVDAQPRRVVVGAGPAVVDEAHAGHGAERLVRGVHEGRIVLEMVRRDVATRENDARHARERGGNAGADVGPIEPGMHHAGTQFLQLPVEVGGRRRQQWMQRGEMRAERRAAANRAGTSCRGVDEWCECLRRWRRRAPGRNRADGPCPGATGCTRDADR